MEEMNDETEMEIGMLSEEIFPELLIQRVVYLYSKISQLDSLRPCEEVNALFSELVSLCIRPCTIDILSIDSNIQAVRCELIHLCGQAEGLLESHFSIILGRLPQPPSQLHLFPYYSNYRKLALMEFQMLCQSGVVTPKRLAFVGSGPLPLTSMVLALHYMPCTMFDNYDIDADANKLATELVRGDPDLSARMAFHTCNIKKVKERLREYEVVFLAALVGIDGASKAEVIEHLAKQMREGATLVVRSARGARAFLYPVVDEGLLEATGFDVVSVVHPTDEVLNSVIIATKSRLTAADEEEQEQEQEG